MCAAIQFSVSHCRRLPRFQFDFVGVNMATPSPSTPARYRLGRAQRPEVEETMKKKETIQHSKTALLWGMVNFIMATAMLFELFLGPVARSLNLTHPVVWYSECAIAAVFTFNFLVDFISYLGPALSPKPVELTEKQQKLLGVKDSDPGFKVSPEKAPSSVSPDGTIPFSPSNVSFSPGSSFSSHGSGSPGSPGSTNTTMSPSLFSPLTPISPLSSSYTSPSSPGHVTYHNQSQSFYGSPSTSFGRNTSPYTSMNTYGLSALFRETPDSNGLMRRASRNSPMSADNVISDMGSLRQYLQEQEEREFKSQLASDSSPSSGPSYWNFNRSAMDYTPVLRKYQYQIASRSPQSAKKRSSDDPDHPAKYTGDEVWLKLGVSREELDCWTENLRKWLSQTIFRRLVTQINEINRELSKIGCEDMQIGEVSISTLKQLGVTKSQYVPTLNTVIPFLEVTSKQEYLVERIKELGKGGCLSDFNWNGGCDVKGKPWGEHLPTDCAIVMHALCSYMDSRLPPHPKYPDGKTFTSEHFIKTPTKPNLTKKDQLLLYQTGINPPHYKVINGDDTWDVVKGRNNMFHCILLFLHHIKTKEHGMLGRVNLGMSGINILWVLDTS
ncbi:transmembrane protein 209 [Lingula anatina]|uniref:Transmembrane protein 209 n=1 Tax=Lingula anatina TaxID=7574 RepID=A0A1S3HII1_LINAN|nr:transmembrane protein 209 [Lingula anatina]|eukprot:XP_013385276.1 transmembrane protein 209 [Lingula anatina]